MPTRSPTVATAARAAAAGDSGAPGFRRGSAVAGLAAALAVPALLLAPTTAIAQRADDNAVRAAEDAFGTSVGNENIGLYSPFEVRGFSAIDAGNVRIDGLYFDRQVDLSGHVSPGGAIRVGISAQGYPLPAPTGIADYGLALAGKERVISGVVGYGPFGGGFAEFDAKLPLAGETLGLAGGATVSREHVEDGRRDQSWGAGGTLRWRPTESLEVVPFWSRTVTSDAEAPPLIFMAGAFLPPKIPRGRFFGQVWTDSHIVGTNYGVLANAQLGGGLSLRAGAFRSEADISRSYADLFLNTTADGLADHLIIADRDQRFASTSGELRLTETFDAGTWRHTLHAVARARRQDRRYGGSDVLDAGRARIGVVAPLTEPTFTFGPQTSDRVSQSTGALAYQGRWGRRLELGAGVQKSNYRKQVLEPGATEQEGRDAPWLYDASAALHVNDRLALYASRATGLEEGGVAPQNATNKDSAAPAIRTQQWDAGLRWAITGELALIAGAFDVRKPYYALDGGNAFRRLGEERHRGLELSVTGRVTPSLQVVAGTVRMQPRVNGEEVAAGRVGRIPVGQVERLTIASAEWTVPNVKGWSADVTLVSVGPRMASTDNRLAVPSRTTYDLGARWRFELGSAPATLRVQLGNVTNLYGWRTNGSGVIVYNAQRRWSVVLAADF